jgi:hypothetical protein
MDGSVDMWIGAYGEAALPPPTPGKRPKNCLDVFFVPAFAYKYGIK